MDHHSNNEDAYFDNYGTLEADSYGDASTKMAYAAMVEEAMERLDLLD